MSTGRMTDIAATLRDEAPLIGTALDWVVTPETVIVGRVTLSEAAWALNLEANPLDEVSSRKVLRLFFAAVAAVESFTSTLKVTLILVVRREETRTAFKSVTSSEWTFNLVAMVVRKEALAVLNCVTVIPVRSIADATLYLHVVHLAAGALALALAEAEAAPLLYADPLLYAEEDPEAYPEAYPEEYE